MREREFIYYSIYSIFFLLAVLSGTVFGFKGYTHTPPAPYIIELFILPVGLINFLIDALMRKSLKAHIIGLTANGLVMAYVLILAFY